MCFISVVFFSSAWVYVKRGTHPEPAGTCRNLPEPPGTHPEPSRNHPDPHGIFPQPPGTVTENQNIKIKQK